jgi:nicotinate phosphoribosyltransferase
MTRAYWHEGLLEEAVFSLFVRRLPPTRNYLVACGLEDALAYLENLRFAPASLDYLATLPEFTDDFLAWLSGLRFTGSVRAVPEGTPVFAGEPLLEVRAPLPEAQLAETYVMNQVHLATLLASKAARVVTAAGGRTVVDFGLRRMHGTDAGMKAARAFCVAGIGVTSNLAAGSAYGIPVSGTMAHSYIQAHEDEEEAFRAFASLYPGTTLLVDTYDTLEGVRTVARLASELGEAFTVDAIRLDSGDLAALSRESRRILDGAGLEEVSIFASGGLDEDLIADLVAADAPIDGFGVGTSMGVSRDAPALDIAYKLVAYGGEGRIKLSPGKELLPGPKQVYREEEGGVAIRDHLTRADEDAPGRPLLVPVMEEGHRLAAGRVTMKEASEVARREIARLPGRVRALRPAEPTYPVLTSARLEADQARAARRAQADGPPRA